ncbi:MAG TPA: hypothetical protein VFQ36_08150 [Ktedonobacteraceae bacterium]|nr:hypothetical protein [Ktedonobacteraceae bacterium]
MRFNEQTRNAQLTFLNGIAEYLFSNMQTELARGNLPRQGTEVLDVIANPSTHPDIYQRMLTEFAQEPLYKQIITDGLWPFQLWLLSCAKRMQPLPTREDMSPWLSLPSWDKLDKVLKLDLPAGWEYVPMFNLSKREIPRYAIPTIKTYEKKFVPFMCETLQQGSQSRNQDFINVMLSLFKAIIIFDEQATKNNTPEYSYPNRVGLLLDLLNAVPKDPGVIEALFAIVPFKTPYQLTLKEFDRVVAGCSPEVLAARSASLSLMTYLQEFILTLTPKQLMYKNTVTLLKQFQQSNNLAAPSDSIARAVNAWLVIHTFLTSKVFDEELLLNIKPALEYLVPQLQQRGQNIWQTFIEEMAPHLVALIKTEPDLQTVLSVFEGAHVVSAWDLLNALAACAGATLTENLSRLIPYLLRGIYKYESTKQPQAELDAYLQTLFKQASDNTLKDVDTATSSRIWPDLINKEWKGWRERTKTSWRDNLPIVGKKTNAGQSKPPTGPQQPQGQATNPNSTFGTVQPDQRGQPAPNPAPPPAPNSVPPIVPTRVVQPQARNSVPPAASQMAPYQPALSPTLPAMPLVEQQARPAREQHATPPHQPAMPPVGQQGQPKPTPPEKGLQINVTIGERLYPIHVNNYERLRHTWFQVLQYWPRVLTDRLNKGRSKVISSELQTIVFLQDELKMLPESTISELLVEYLVQDMLIQFEVERICQTENQSFLQAVNYIDGRLDEFKNFVGVNYYRELCKNVTEQAVKDVLQKLIRRYHLIQHMDSQKWDWNKWLEKEKKSAKYKYHNVQVWA